MEHAVSKNISIGVDYRKDLKLFPLQFLLNAIRNLPHPTMYRRCLFQGVLLNFKKAEIFEDFCKKVFCTSYQMSFWMV